MSLANVVLYAGLLVLMVYKRAQGRPIGTTKQLFLLPAIITVLGFEDLSHAKLGTIDIAVGVAGCGLSLLLGALRGTQDKLSRRDGTPWVQWGAVSVVIFAVNIVAKLALDVAGVALGRGRRRSRRVDFGCHGIAAARCRPHAGRGGCRGVGPAPGRHSVQC